MIEQEYLNGPAAIFQAQQCVENGASAGIVGLISMTLLTSVNIFGLLGRSALPPFSPLNKHKGRVWELACLLLTWLFALAGFGVSVYNAVKACDMRYGLVWSIPLLNILRAVYGALQAVVALVLGHYKFILASVHYEVVEVIKSDEPDYVENPGPKEVFFSHVTLLCWAGLIALGGYTFIAPLALLHFREINEDDSVRELANWVYLAFWGGAAVLYTAIMFVSGYTPLKDVSLGKRAFLVIVILGGMLMPIFVELIVSLTYRTTLIVPSAWRGIFLWLGLSQHFILFTQ